MNTETINLIVKGLITLAVYVVVGVVIPLIKSKIGTTKLAQIEEYCDIAVRTAEMLFTTEQFKEKKDFAVDYVTKKAKEIGITLSVEDINNIIESAVNDLKYTYVKTKE